MTYSLGAAQRSHDAREPDDDLPHTDLCERIVELQLAASRAFNRCPPHFAEGFGYAEDANRALQELLALRGGAH